MSVVRKSKANYRILLGLIRSILSLCGKGLPINVAQGPKWASKCIERR
jgi:hypothetical protein